MKLTKHTDYAFRVLIYLAAIDKDKLATIKEVTTAFDISRDHVMKIVQKLAKAGYIDAVRGKFGGMRLGRDKHDINVRDVVALMEVTLSPVDCETKLCLIKPGCELRTILFEAQEKFLGHLEQFSLADIAKPDSETLHIINLL